MAPRRTTHRERTAQALAAQLASLPDLPLDDLKERWRDLYGAAPPPRLSRALLTRAVAYRLQEQALGGLRSATRRRLAGAVGDIGAGRTPAAASATVKPGTRLLREWRGVTHEVIVLETGVQYRGAVWPSLSAVAREITGARWSGPLFFGLRKRHDGR